MPRLRTVSPRDRGWTRVRHGKGFRYLDHEGKPLPAEDVARIKALVIPPAWQDVWICRYPNGHIQAVGTDDAGRRQYLYHPQWRIKRDRLKHDRVLAAAAQLPKARERISADLAREGMPLERADAVAARLLDLGYFRIGSDAYADAHGSFGLTTLEKRHVRRRGQVLVFRFTGKSGVEHTVEIDDADVIAALDRMRRRAGGERLLAFQQGRRWSNLDAASVNLYLSELFDGELTAKDFRTWHATVIAAAALAASEEPGDSKASRKRAVRQAVVEVSEYLGNTPTVARGSYIDPRIIDLYESGKTIDPALVSEPPVDPMARQLALEQAVLDLLGSS